MIRHKRTRDFRTLEGWGVLIIAAVGFFALGFLAA